MFAADRRVSAGTGTGTFRCLYFSSPMSVRAETAPTKRLFSEAAIKSIHLFNGTFYL